MMLELFSPVDLGVVEAVVDELGPRHDPMTVGVLTIKVAMALRGLRRLGYVSVPTPTAIAVAYALESRRIFQNPPAKHCQAIADAIAPYVRAIYQRGFTLPAAA